MDFEKYEFKPSNDLFYLIECIKVESYWSYKNNTLTLQNKNLPFLTEIERILKELNLNISKRVLIKIKPTSINKEHDKIELTKEGKELHWYFEKSPFDGSLKIITSLPYSAKICLILQINDFSYNISIVEGTENYEIKSDLASWAYLDLRFPSKRILSFLNEYLGEDKILRVEKLLVSLDKEKIMAAFSGLIDCEGSINHYGLFRKISIRMKPYEYLNDWKLLLGNLGIQSRIDRRGDLFGLVIEGAQDFLKLKELGFKPRNSKKEKEWRNLLQSYKRFQVSRSSAKSFYLEKIKEQNQSISALVLSKILNKSKRVVSHYLKLLCKEGSIKVDKSKMPFLYYFK